MVRSRATNAELNAQLSSLTKNQKKALLGLAEVVGAGGEIASVQVVREPTTTTGLTKSKKKQNAFAAKQIQGGGGKGKAEVIKPPPRRRRSQRNKTKKDGADGIIPNVASGWVQKVNQVKTAFPSAEEGRPVSVRREKLKGRNAPAARKRTKAALVLNKAKESRQAAITAKRRKSSGPAGLIDTAQKKRGGGEPSKEKKAVNKEKKNKKQEKKAKVATSRKEKAISEKMKALGPEELETQMNTYWFEAGKGKDPKEMKLDSSMDDYWSKKPPLVPPLDALATEPK